MNPSSSPSSSPFNDEKRRRRNSIAGFHLPGVRSPVRTPRVPAALDKKKKGSWSLSPPPAHATYASRLNEMKPEEKSPSNPRNRSIQKLKFSIVPLLRGEDHLFSHFIVRAMTAYYPLKPPEMTDPVLFGVIGLHGDPERLFVDALRKEALQVQTVASIMRERTLAVVVLQYMWQAIDITAIVDKLSTHTCALVCKGMKLLQTPMEELPQYEKQWSKLKQKLLASLRESLLDVDNLVWVLPMLCAKAVRIVKSLGNKVVVGEGQTIAQWSLGAMFLLRFLIPKVVKKTEGKEGGLYLAKILMRMCSGSYLSGSCLANDLLCSLFEEFNLFCDRVVKRGESLHYLSFSDLKADLSPAPNVYLLFSNWLYGLGRQVGRSSTSERGILKPSGSEGTITRNVSSGGTFGVGGGSSAPNLVGASRHRSPSTGASPYCLSPTVLGGSPLGATCSTPPDRVCSSSPGGSPGGSPISGPLGFGVYGRRGSAGRALATSAGHNMNSDRSSGNRSTSAAPPVRLRMHSGRSAGEEDDHSVESGCNTPSPLSGFFFSQEEEWNLANMARLDLCEHENPGKGHENELVNSDAKEEDEEREIGEQGDQSSEETLPPSLDLEKEEPWVKFYSPFEVEHIYSVVEELSELISDLNLVPQEKEQEREETASESDSSP